MQEDYADLHTPTKVLMVYYNFEMDYKQLFNVLTPTPMENVPRTRKGNISKKSIQAPKGAIINVRIMDKKENLKGLDVRTKTEKEKKKRQRQENFMYQISVLFSMGDYKCDIMFFKKRMKIANCQGDPSILIKAIWEYIIAPHASCVRFFGDPEFFVVIVMKNKKFDLGVEINRECLNNTCVSRSFDEDSDIEFSVFWPTGNSAVNIKFKSKIENCTYEKYTLRNTGWHTEICKTNPYDTGKPKFTTLLVQRSSKGIITGWNDIDMSHAYKTLIHIINSVEGIIVK